MTRSQLPVRLSPTPVRALSARLRASEFVRDLTRHGYLPLACTLILLVAFLVGLASGGSYLTPEGEWAPIPTEAPPSCGDYCGTDAGF